MMVALATILLALPARAQWVTESEQFYLPAEHNWVFRRSYPQADRLFHAFDYGHAILYEELYRRPNARAERLEEREYAFITTRLLNRPPRLPLEEAAIAPGYAALAPEAKLMFEWAHLLHRQIYDVLADERLSEPQRDAAVSELLAYYRTRPELAFSRRPKNMELMEGQAYSTAFRTKYPRFNGLIWAYHWLQVGLYEPLLTGRTSAERQTGITAAVTRFRQMLEGAPTHMPRVMPMTPAVAPTFAARYPEAAIVFDNLHGMHDVISDILASPVVPAERKREEILRAAALYRDDSSFVVTEDGWREMSLAMGVENMGGPVTGFLAAFPTPTVERGAVMAHADHAAHGNAAAAPHPQGAEMNRGRAPEYGDPPRDAAPPSDARVLYDLLFTLLGDSVVIARVTADSALLGSVRAGMEKMPMPDRTQTRLQRFLTPGTGPEADNPSEEVVRQAGELVVLLLADPQVMARVHASPELHRRWSDPRAQRALAAHPAGGAPHRH